MKSTHQLSIALGTMAGVVDDDLADLLHPGPQINDRKSRRILRKIQLPGASNQDTGTAAY